MVAKAALDSKAEVYCPDCDTFITPKVKEVNQRGSASKVPYTYEEYWCGTCNTVLLQTKRRLV